MVFNARWPSIREPNCLALPEGRKVSPMTEFDSKVAAENLAKRLRLLLDVVSAESGREPTYAEIASFLGERGINLSRSRWTYIVNGHRYVEDRPLVDGLAAFFNVDAAFLVGEIDAESPARVSAQLDLVRAMRAARVKSYAARTLGDISPEALRAISKFLDEEMPRK
jgi:transcriptional regulator with XRE-family HTH domain